MGVGGESTAEAVLVLPGLAQQDLSLTLYHLLLWDLGLSQAHVTASAPWSLSCSPGNGGYPHPLCDLIKAERTAQGGEEAPTQTAVA